MSYTRKNIKNLTGGVSQQPDSERFDNQCSEQINFLSDPVKGLSKRAGTNYVEHIASPLCDYEAKHTFTHVINRSADEQLMLVVGYDPTGSATPKMELFKLNEGDAEELEITDGEEPPTTITTHPYLNGSTGTHPLSAVTIADYTFLANSTKTPALKTATSGGAGMYEREHVKRGLIFVKESAYNSEFTVKATDSEGTTRTFKAFTTNGSGSDGRKDIKSDAIAGAIHQGLERTSESSGGTTFTTASAGSYTDSSTGIVTRWSDDSDDHLFNGNGGTTALSGSNYSRGLIIFTEQPSATNEISIDGGPTEIYHFEFYANGGTPLGWVGITDVEIGTTIDETAENFANALNGISGVVFTASLTWIDGLNPHVGIVSKVEGDISASNGGIISITGFSAVKSNIQGGDDDPALSTACVRHPIKFERVNIENHDGTAQTSGSVISWFASYPTKEDADASLINIEVSDSYGDTMVQTFTEVTDRISALPSIAPNNYLMKVEGDVENSADDHYIKFTSDSSVATNNQFGGGKWKEDMQSGLQYQLDETTMPHQLIKVDSSTYKFVAADWSDKTVGDFDSDAPPSFVGAPIKDMFFYKSRLGLLAGESVILSETNNAYNFWNTSVITSVDSDRIDISSSVNEITYLNWAIPFANQLIIFSDRAQFLLSQGSQGLTPSTASLSLGSSYENSSSVRPVVNDRSILFAQDKSGASSVYEMRPTGSTELGFEANSITEHLPSYIQGKIINIAASSLADTAVVQTDSGDNTLYVYKYYVGGGKRLQSAWSKYEIACDYLKGGHFISDKFHIIEGHQNGTATGVGNSFWVLSYLRFDNTDSLTNAIDLSYDVPISTMNYDSGTGETTIAAEWHIANNSTRKGKIVVFDKTNNETYSVNTDDSSAQNVLVTGDIENNTNIVMGLSYSASYEFSKQYLKNVLNGTREVAVTDGRTTTKWVEVYFNDTQHLTTTVSYPRESDFRDSHSKVYTGSFSGGAVTGDQPSETSKLRTVVAARSDLPSITLSSDTHQTVTITGAAFELLHTSRLRGAK